MVRRPAIDSVNRPISIGPVQAANDSFLINLINFWINNRLYRVLSGLVSQRLKIVILRRHSVRSSEAVTGWKRGTIITGRLTSLVALRDLPTEGVRRHSSQYYSPFS